MFYDLTIFLVIKDFHVFFLFSSKCFFYFTRRDFICVLTTKEVTAAVPLNQFCSTVACELAKPVVTVNNRKIRNLSISQDKISIRCKNLKIKVQVLLGFKSELRLPVESIISLLSWNLLTWAVKFLYNRLNKDVLGSHKASLHRHDDYKTSVTEFRPPRVLEWCQRTFAHVRGRSK